jgi:hypothetical protein
MATAWRLAKDVEVEKVAGIVAGRNLPCQLAS